MDPARTWQELLDLEAIKQLKYRYLRHLDLKEWEQLRECFSTDARAAYADGEYSFDGRDAIVNFLREVLGSTDRLSLHRCHHPEIQFDGAERARGRWALDDLVIDRRSGTVLQGAAYYEDEYVRVGGDWRIAFTSYRRVFEQIWQEKDMPSLIRRVPWWEKDQPS
ncbi:MAG: nuclear transport factor 2 family protein [Candidatus Binatia bacterium]|nr:nuclear transport factor 2 family protein [Candidatus Binatia bacterium]